MTTAIEQVSAPRQHASRQAHPVSEEVASSIRVEDDGAAHLVLSSLVLWNHLDDVLQGPRPALQMGIHDGTGPDRVLWLRATPPGGSGRRRHISLAHEIALGLIGLWS